MKSVCILLVTCLYFLGAKAKLDLPPDLQKVVAQLHSHCLEEQKLNEEDFKKFDITKKEPKMMCYLKCVFVNFQFMDEKENLQVDFIKQNIHPALKNAVLPYIDNCVNAAVGGQCERSYNFFSCMRKADPEDWVIL